jgi:hypothetical protein
MCFPAYNEILLPSRREWNLLNKLQVKLKLMLVWQSGLTNCSWNKITYCYNMYSM